MLQAGGIIYTRHNHPHFTGLSLGQPYLQYPFTCPLKSYTPYFTSSRALGQQMAGLSDLPIPSMPRPYLNFSGIVMINIFDQFYAKMAIFLKANVMKSSFLLKYVF
jgi:hypothetical protein